uniref:Uncharacterized protein n=1 Tax=Anguilla anguilla TaxID=7936 RepID=A0A0E9TZI5_ANGAN
MCKSVGQMTYHDSTTHKTNQWECYFIGAAMGMPNFANT